MNSKINNSSSSPDSSSTPLADWVLVSFKRIANEMNDNIRFVKAKRKDIDDLKVHQNSSTYPKWFPRTNYKPKPCTKFPVQVVNWDQINEDHDKLVLVNLIQQYEAELKAAEVFNNVEYYSKKLENECMETARFMFGETKDEATNIPASKENEIRHGIQAGKDRLIQIYSSKYYSTKLAEIEASRRREANFIKELNKQDRMEGIDQEITPAMQTMISKMVDLKLKKIGNKPPKKASPAPIKGKDGNKAKSKGKTVKAPNAPSKAKAQAPTVKTAPKPPAKGKGPANPKGPQKPKPYKPKAFSNKSRSNYSDFSKN